MSETRSGPLTLVEVAIEPKSEADQKTLLIALSEMAAEDPSFGFYTDRESGQAILTGVDERQLDHKIDVLKRIYGVQPDIGAPHVAYRETLGCAVEIDHTYSRIIGPKGDFARVRLRFEPGQSGSDFQFRSKAGESVPDEYIPGITKGLEEARKNGLIAGFPVIDFAATLVDGAYHDVDSSQMAFEIASRAAFKELREKGAPKLLEPIMKVEVLTPDEYLGDVIGDLNSRRGQIQGADQRGNTQVVTAFVPLANMFGYGSALQALTQGRAEFAMQYDHYTAMPDFDPEPPTFRPATGMRA